MANILYIAQFFSLDSEPGGQGQRHFKHAQSLAEDGHFVTVITGGGTTMCQDGHRLGTDHSLVDQYLQAGLRVIRIATPSLDRRDVLSRAKCYFAFSLAALLAGLKLTFAEKRRFGFVLGSSPPLLVALVAYILALFNRADFYMEVRDLWSQTMAANGFVTNRLFLNLNRAVESWLYRKARRIIVLSPAFVNDIETQTPCVHHKIEIIPNGADLEFYQYPQLWQESYLRATPEEQALFHVNYAGVFSDYTKLEVLLAVAAVMQERNPNIRFNLAGGGYQFNKLRRMAEEYELWNVKFWEALPKNRISKFIMEGDLSIINYRALPIFGKVLPNKLFDYLAAGRPILAAVPEGEVSRVLKQSKAGMTVPPENVMAIVEAITWFHDHPKQGLKMGVQAYNFVTRNFDRRHLVNRLLGLFPRVIPLHATKGREGVTSSDVRIANIQ